MSGSSLGWTDWKSGRGRPSGGKADNTTAGPRRTSRLRRRNRLDEARIIILGVADPRAAVFDQPAWEESMFFAVERVSREDGGAAVVAHAVRLALPIDPMLAAEMIYRASSAVWEDCED